MGKLLQITHDAADYMDVKSLCNTALLSHCHLRQSLVQIHVVLLGKANTGLQQCPGSLCLAHRPVKLGAESSPGSLHSGSL